MYASPGMDVKSSSSSARMYFARIFVASSISGYPSPCRSRASRRLLPISNTAGV